MQQTPPGSSCRRLLQTPRWLGSPETLEGPSHRPVDAQQEKRQNPPQPRLSLIPERENRWSLNTSAKRRREGPCAYRVAGTLAPDATKGNPKTAPPSLPMFPVATSP